MAGTVVGIGHLIMNKIHPLLSKAENLVVLSKYFKTCQ